MLSLPLCISLTQLTSPSSKNSYSYIAQKAPQTVSGSGVPFAGVFPLSGRNDYIIWLRPTSQHFLR
ncbi:hypothetical protein, partial [Paenibacillus sp. TAF43_2]|uniref:hypothetical protein n=1 Tax=Paenibacillus sp. TAF43_2 TaxID=3233069 RepID=UPI003F9BCC83